MTRYNRFDHDAALAALNIAREKGVEISAADVATLNRAGGSYALNMPEDLPRHEFEEALNRVRAAMRTTAEP